jgi:Domain of unknown function (DUF397)
MPELTRSVWRKSTYSVNQWECVEVAEGQDGCAVRDSRTPLGRSSASAGPRGPS